jgi:hypothetical protein
MNARLAALLQFAAAAAATAVHPYEHTYRSSPLTPIALNITVTTPSFSASRPLLLAAPYGPGVSSPGPTLYDGATGAPVWHAPEWGAAHDLQVQTLSDGRKALSFWTGAEIQTGWVNGTVVLLDARYRVLRAVAARAPYRADFHEFGLVEPARTSAVLTSYNRIPANLSAIGGPADGWVLDSLVQEVALDEAGTVLFNWSAWEHLPLNETYALPGTRGDGTFADPLDVAHVNAVDASAPDGKHLLISSRHYQQLLKVDRATGAIVWRLGGMRSDFALGAGAAFHFQHHARWHAGGRAISLFDNGASDWEAVESTARGVYLSVDEAERRVALVREWLPLYRNTTKMMGDVQLLPGGNVWVAFGTSPWVMERTWDGALLFWAALGAGGPEAANGPVASDRVFKTTEWVGRPAVPPAMAVVLNATAVEVYVSWNGATEVRAWALLAGEVPARMEVVARMTKAGFEDRFVLGKKEAKVYVAVRAVGHDGATLGTTGVQRVADGVQAVPGSVV